MWGGGGGGGAPTVNWVVTHLNQDRSYKITEAPALHYHAPRNSIRFAKRLARKLLYFLPKRKNWRSPG